MTKTAAATSKPKARKINTVTTTDTLVRLLSQEAGSPMAELVAELKVLPATIRAMISMLRKKRGLRIDLVDGRYRIII